MVEYNCPRCGYTTTRKGNMRDHINRKKLCKGIICDDIIPKEHIDKILKGIKSTEKVEFMQKKIEILEG